ncbi:MAG: hypothetical protein WCT20_03810 [Candidatus Babeliales bacterium]
MSTKLSRVILICSIACSQAVAHDLPVFYRAAVLDGQPGKSVDDWHSTLSISYLQGETSHAWNEHGHKCGLLDAWGQLDVTQLGVGVQSKVAPLTTYWNDSGTGSFDTATFTGNDGKVSIAGHSETKELSLNLRQNLFSGFYLFGYVPVREIKNNRITPTYLGTNADVQAFLGTNFSGDFATILSAYGYRPLTTSYRKTEVSDTLVGVGWQGIDTTSFDIIDSLSGGGEIGVTIPFGAQQKQNCIASVPTGYNGHWGIKAQLAGEVGLWKFLGFGAATSATMFFREERTIHMKTDEDQPGIIALDSGYAQVDHGSLWSVSGYAKITPAAMVSCYVGASFVRQEKTELEVRDDVFLSTVVANSLIPDEDGNVLAPLVSKDEVVNSDERFQAWEMYTLHLKATVDMSSKIKSFFAPAVSFQYSLPLAGKHVFPSDVMSGTFDANLQWKF